MALKPGTRMTTRGEQTREQIMQAARRLFTRRGYHYTSVYDLFDHAETTKGAFFHHWKTKEDLALSILEQMETYFNAHYFCIMEGEGRSRDKIETLIRLIAEKSSGDGGYGRLFATWCMEMAEDEDQLGPAVHRLKTRWCELWKELICRAQKEQDMRADISAENLSFLVVSAIFGVQLMKREGAPGTESVYEALRRTLLT